MSVTLRVILESPAVHPSDDVQLAAQQLTRALVEQAPRGCDVGAVVPSGAADIEQIVPGLNGVKTLSLARRELLAAWRLGVGPGAGDRLVHSPTLAAPLRKHGEDGEQTVVTLWDFDAWDDADSMPKGTAPWYRAMMKRAEKHADAIVVPTFEHARRAAEMWRISERLHVVAAAAPLGFSVPGDAEARAAHMELPESYVLLDGTSRAVDGLATALGAVRTQISDERMLVITGVPEDDVVGVRELVSIAGIPQEHVRVMGWLAPDDRAVVIGRAKLLVATQTATVWPWRVVEAFRLGTPVVALDTPVLREIVAEDMLLAHADGLAALVGNALGEREAAARVLSKDRGRSYSWQSSANQIWQLHAEL